MHVELLAQCGETRVVAIREEEGCNGELGQTGIARGIGSIEPLEHLVGLLANGVENSDLKCAAVRILGDKILERGVGRRSVALRLLHQSDGVVAPETFVLELRIRHRLCWTVLQNIERGEVSMKTRSARLKLKSFAKRFLRLLCNGRFRP